MSEQPPPTTSRPAQITADWQAQIDAYANLGQFSNGAPKVEDIMTLDVLGATADVRPKIG